MTEAPSIKEALDSLLAFRHGDTKHLTSEHARVLYAALATFQPDGERRETIARIFIVSIMGKEPRWDFNDMVPALTLEQLRMRIDAAILASGLVQDEAGEPTATMIDAGVAFALSVSLSGEYRWSQYVADLYKTMRAAAIRSARDGGAES